MKKTKIKLEPYSCNKCGNNTPSKQYNTESFDKMHFRYKCYDCGKTTVWLDCEDKAIKKWNLIN